MSIIVENRCVECKQVLTSGLKMYSNGVCPYCGYISSSPTICKTYRTIYRVVSNKKHWWEFWVKPSYELISEEKH